MQHHLAQRRLFPKVHLHPLRRVLVFLNVAVVTHRVAFLGGLRQRGDFLVEIHERLADIDAWSGEARAAEILVGLGFTQNDLTRACKEFSGGWRMRAALGGVLAIFLGINLVPFGLFGCAMIGAGASILLLLAIGRGGGPIGFILGGMVLSTLAGALTAFVISIAPNPFAASEIINWLMGALTDRLMQDVLTALPFMAIGALLLVLLAGPALYWRCMAAARRRSGS